MQGQPHNVPSLLMACPSARPDSAANRINYVPSPSILPPQMLESVIIACFHEEDASFWERAQRAALLHHSACLEFPAGTTLGLRNSAGR